MDKLRVVPCETEHIDAVAEILTAGAQLREQHENGARWPNPYPPELVMPSLDAGFHSAALVGLDESDKPVATVTVAINSLMQANPWNFLGSHQLGIGRFAVHPDYRGIGIGKSLLDGVEEAASETGYFPEFLLHCAAEAVTLRRYYEKLGFIHKGTFSRIVAKDDDGRHYYSPTGYVGAIYGRVLARYIPRSSEDEASAPTFTVDRRLLSVLHSFHGFGQSFSTEPRDEFLRRARISENLSAEDSSNFSNFERIGLVAVERGIQLEVN